MVFEKKKKEGRRRKKKEEGRRRKKDEEEGRRRRKKRRRRGRKKMKIFKIRFLGFYKPELKSEDIFAFIIFNSFFYMQSQ